MVARILEAAHGSISGNGAQTDRALPAAFKSRIYLAQIPERACTSCTGKLDLGREGHSVTRLEHGR